MTPRLSVEVLMLVLYLRDGVPYAGGLYALHEPQLFGRLPQPQHHLSQEAIKPKYNIKWNHTIRREGFTFS